MRRIALLLFAILCAAPGAAAQRSGLLLSFSNRTLWIAPVGGKMTVAADIPALIVPRDDGFHHLGTVQWCDVAPGPEMPGPFYSETDVLVDLKVGEPRPLPDASTGEMECAEAMAVLKAHGDSVARQDSIALTQARSHEDSVMHAPPGEDTSDEGDLCGFLRLRITYASPRYLSTAQSEGTTEFCSPGRYTSSERRSTLRADSGGEVGLLEHLPALQRRRLLARWEQEKGSCALEETPDQSWGIERAFGEWHAAFATSGATACRGESGNEDNGFSIVQRVPLPLARRDPVERWLPQLKAFAPKISDAFVSPTNDLVVARVGKQLAIFVPRGKRLGAPIITVDIPDDAVVMAEWATGSHVDRWTEQLRVVHERW